MEKLASIINNKTLKMAKKNSKKVFIHNIWICGFNPDLQKIIGWTVWSNNKEMVNYICEDGTSGIIEYHKVQNIYRIEPDFKKEKFLSKMTLKEKKANTKALKDLLSELKIDFNKK